ncbi:MAG: DUF1574 domain-containing protein, partial [Spirochaetia bacterium]|nr:DUF1574 domain-containing protein [Spirochaetia bacterium]
YFGKIEGISFFTLIKNLDQYSLTTIREIFITRMFASYRYKLSWNKIVKSKKEESSLFMGLMVMSEKEKVHEKLDIKLDVNQLKDVQVGKIPEYDYMTRFKLITSMVEKAYLASWQLDNSSIDTLDSLIRIANEKNIPVVLWRPDVHPLLKELYAKKNIDKNFEPVLMKVIQKHQVPYLKFNSTDKLKCNYFTDASHISTRCCTEMAARLTETLENR